MTNAATMPAAPATMTRAKPTELLGDVDPKFGHLKFELGDIVLGRRPVVKSRDGFTGGCG